MDQKFKSVTDTEYEVLSVTPVTGGLCAVYAVLQENSEKLILKKIPLRLIGVAKVTVTTYRGQDPNLRCQENIHNVFEHNMVVGFSLNDGYLEPCNYDEDFAGLCYEDSNPYDHMDWLRGNLIDQLEPDPTKKGAHG